MRKGLAALGVLALALVMFIPETAQAATVVHADVRLAPLGRSYAPPPLGRKDGWLAISNRDWQDYTFVIDKKGRASLYRGSQRYSGGIRIPSGTTVTVALEKDTWDIYGNNPDKLKVKVREGRTSTLSLEPFGRVGRTGLMGITNDGDKVRNEVLFTDYSAPVVVQPPPTVVVPAPPPPPVIINRPPVIVERPRPRPPVHHRPPPPPSRPHRNDGWGFSFGFNSGR